MQQMYMIPDLRSAILSLQIPARAIVLSPHKNQRKNLKISERISASLTRPQESAGPNLLSQLQVMFGNLQESEKQYYDPEAFCRAYDPNINVHQQQVLKYSRSHIFHITPAFYIGPSIVDGFVTYSAAGRAGVLQLLLRPSRDASEAHTAGEAP
jgi:hypothetical protein